MGYLAVRLLHVSLFALAARGNRPTLRGVWALAISTVPGAGLTILASVAFEGATRHSVSRSRVVAAAACVALIPVATRVPGLVALALLAAVWVALIAFQSSSPTRGELDLATVDDLAESLDELRRAGWRAVALDLGDVSFMDLTGLRALLKAQGAIPKRRRRTGDRRRVPRGQPPPRRLRRRASRSADARALLWRPASVWLPTRGPRPLVRARDT